MMEERAAQLEKRFKESEAGGGAAHSGADPRPSMGGENRFNVNEMAPRDSVSFADQKEMLQNIREKRSERRARKVQPDQ